MITLMPIEESDLDRIRGWRNDDRIRKWCRNTGLIHPDGHQEWFKRTQTDETCVYYKILTGMSVFIGVCGLTDIDTWNKRAEFSIYLGPEFHGQGRGAPALRELLRRGFQDRGLHSIWGETFDGNPAARLFERVGMKKDGVRRGYYFRDGSFVDSVLYSITVDEWNAC